MQLLLGCCCLGLVKTYMPKTLINACLTAAAVRVIVAQLTFIFDIVLDIPASPLDIFYVSQFIISQRNECFLEGKE